MLRVACGRLSTATMPWCGTFLIHCINSNSNHRHPLDRSCFGQIRYPRTFRRTDSLGEGKTVGSLALCIPQRRLLVDTACQAKGSTSPFDACRLVSVRLSRS